MNCAYCDNTEVSKHGNCVGCGRYRKEEIAAAKKRLERIIMLSNMNIQREMLQTMMGVPND